MNTIDDFTRRLGWQFIAVDPPNDTYPQGHLLMITRSPLPVEAVDLTWMDLNKVRNEIVGITFDENNGCIDGNTGDGQFHVNVALIAGRLQGEVTLVEGDGIFPVVGTWGADVNGGMGGGGAER